MKKIIYTRVEDGGVSIINAAPKESLEVVLGSLTDEKYESHVRERSIPLGALNVRYIEDMDIPQSREFRDAWCDVTPEPVIDIDMVKAKDIKLSQMRTERQKKFEDLGFPVRLNPELESSIISKETRDKLQYLRDATEPLKALVAEGYNDESVLQKIRELGKLNDV